MTKTCTKCKEEKSYENFYKNVVCSDGLEGACKQCRNKTASQNYFKKKTYYSKVRQRWYLKNKDWYLKHCLQRQQEPKVKERRRQTSRVREKYRRHNDINFQLKKNLRCRIWHVLKGNYKSARTMELVGCSIDFLKSHLEAKFTTGMSWRNYGKWHIDHIIPCSFFNLSNPIMQRKCFHYTNLQPLWAKDNMQKQNKLPFSNSN